MFAFPRSDLSEVSANSRDEYLEKEPGVFLLKELSAAGIDLVDPEFRDRYHKHPDGRFRLEPPVEGEGEADDDGKERGTRARPMHVDQVDKVPTSIVIDKDDRRTLAANAEAIASGKVKLQDIGDGKLRLVDAEAVRRRGSITLPDSRAEAEREAKAKKARDAAMLREVDKWEAKENAKAAEDAKRMAELAASRREANNKLPPPRFI